MLVWTLLFIFLAAAPKERSAGPPAPEIPVPFFAEDKRVPPATPYDLELSFRPSPGHYLDDVHRFYSDWAKSKHWRQVSGDEESWSKDRWVYFHDQRGREVWQRLATWVDRTGYWSLRLAMRDYQSPPDNRAFVFLTPFVNIDKVPAQ